MDTSPGPTIPRQSGFHRHPWGRVRDAIVHDAATGATASSRYEPLRIAMGRRPPDTLWRANPRGQGLLGLTDAVAFFGARGWEREPAADRLPALIPTSAITARTALILSRGAEQFRCSDET